MDQPASKMMMGRRNRLRTPAIARPSSSTPTAPTAQENTEPPRVGRINPSRKPMTMITMDSDNTLTSGRFKGVPVLLASICRKWREWKENKISNHNSDELTQNQETFKKHWKDEVYSCIFTTISPAILFLECRRTLVVLTITIGIPTVRTSLWPTTNHPSLSAWCKTSDIRKEPSKWNSMMNIWWHKL